MRILPKFQANHNNPLGLTPGFLHRMLWSQKVRQIVPFLSAVNRLRDPMFGRKQPIPRKTLQRVPHVDKRNTIFQWRREGETLRRRIRRETPLVVEQERQRAAVRMQVIADVGKLGERGFVDELEPRVAGLAVAVEVLEAVLVLELEGVGEAGDDGLAGFVAAVAESLEQFARVLQGVGPFDGSCGHFVS